MTWDRFSGPDQSVALGNTTFLISCGLPRGLAKFDHMLQRLLRNWTLVTEFQDSAFEWLK